MLVEEQIEKYQLPTIEEGFDFLIKKIKPFLEQKTVFEIMVNPGGSVWIDELGRDQYDSGIVLTPNEAEGIINLVASWSGTTISKEKPILSSELPNGERFEGIISPITESPTFTIRKHASMVFTFDDYIEKGVFGEDQKKVFENAVRDRNNILVVGGTGCHAKGTLISMANGKKKAIEDIVVGDHVLGPDFTKRTVLRLHSGRETLVRIEPKLSHRFEPFIVNINHVMHLFQAFTGVDMNISLGHFIEHMPEQIKGLYYLKHVDLSPLPDRKTVGRKNLRAIEIVGFRPVIIGAGEYFGFELDKDKLYLDWQGIVHHNSGKTTLCNAFIHSISKLTPEHRVITLEDTRELQVSSPNVVSLRTSDVVDMTRLLKSCMRLRPDRILVGEVRDASALALLKAWNTGHPGGLATVHANSSFEGLIRLEQLIQEAGIPQHAARPIISAAINMIVFIERTPDGRKITSVLRAHGLKNGEYVVEAIFGDPPKNIN
jgi:Flp pilus assembly CpaF family ATPase